VQAAPNLAVRRFRLIWAVSIGIKVAALAALAVLLAVYMGGL
jgi:hypothetical protein